jgi:hypothetical protein
VRSHARYIRDTRLECRAESGERRRSLHFGNCRKKWGEAAQIDCIAAQKMYRSNRGYQLSAWVQGGGMKSLLAVSVVAAAITAPISSVPLRKPRRP